MEKNIKILKAIKDYILADENKEEIVRELKRYKAQFPMVMDYNWYEYGNILPYYSDIVSFYKDNGIVWVGETHSMKSDMMKHFLCHTRYAIDEIIKEGV